MNKGEDGYASRHHQLQEMPYKDAQVMQQTILQKPTIGWKINYTSKQKK